MAAAASRCCHPLGAGDTGLITLLALVTAFMTLLHWVFEPLEAIAVPLLNLSGIGWIVFGGLIWLVAGRPAGQDDR